MRILITGGTGSFGQRFVKHLIATTPSIERLVIYSRDELKQYEMAQTFPLNDYPFIRFFIGDVRDADRLKRAFQDIDIVVHAAALKHVPIAEYNPIECIRTNIMGAENVINAALATNVKKVIALSTDKAAAPINLYGATKLCADKLFVAANNITGKHAVTFSIVRYGNVFGSRGSVVPFFLKQRETGMIPVTHKDMTRFSITLDEGIHLVEHAIRSAMGGEIFVPKIPSYRILDLVNAVAPNCDIRYTGIRPGEKLHEEMITEMDSLSTIDCGKHYAILPASPHWEINVDDYLQKNKFTRMPYGFHYNSANNDHWLSVDELKHLVHQYEQHLI